MDAIRRRVMAAAAVVAVLTAHAAGAQPFTAAPNAPNAVLLVAKPTLVDPNFRETVVLVTQAGDSSTVGVILNRPSSLKLAELMPRVPGAESYADTVYLGGPVMRQVVIALFHSSAAPKAAAFHVLRDLYLSMHPANVEPLLGASSERFRLYAGFAGWAPRQLEAELERDAWYVLPASEELVFRSDTSGLWQELLEKARGARTGISPAKSG